MKETIILTFFLPYALRTSVFHAIVDTSRKKPATFPAYAAKIDREYPALAGIGRVGQLRQQHLVHRGDGESLKHFLPGQRSSHQLRNSRDNAQASKAAGIRLFRSVTRARQGSRRA